MALALPITTHNTPSHSLLLQGGRPVALVNHSSVVLTMSFTEAAASEYRVRDVMEEACLTWLRRWGRRERLEVGLGVAAGSNN